MNKLFYFASNGLGENLCQMPVIRYLAKDRDVTVVCPDNCDVLFLDLPYVKQVLNWTTVGFKEYGDGTFNTKYLDSNGVEWASAHYTHWNGNGMKPSKGEVRGDYISAYFSRVFGKEILDTLKCNDVVMDPPLQDKSVGHVIDVSIFEGSMEPLRHLPAEYGTKLYRLLSKRGFEVSYFTAGDRGDESFVRVNKAIQRSKLVVSPDSGPLHLALAHGANVLALTTRELAENIINPVYYEQTHIWTMPMPACDQQCQGAQYQQNNNMPRGYRRPMKWPKGVEGKENYPFCLECWKEKKAPCLTFTDEHVRELADTITSILENRPVYTTQPCSNQQGVESSLEASPVSEQPQTWSRSTGNSIQVPVNLDETPSYEASP